MSYNQRGGSQRQSRGNAPPSRQNAPPSRQNAPPSRQPSGRSDMRKSNSMKDNGDDLGRRTSVTRVGRLQEMANEENRRRYNEEISMNETSKWTLRFSSSFLEQSFLSHHYFSYQQRARHVLWIAAVAYGLFAFTDLWWYSADAKALMPIRYILCAFAISVFGLTYVDSIRTRINVMQAALVVVILVALTVNTIIDYIQNDSFAEMQTTGMVLLLAACNTLLKMSFFYTLVSTTLYMFVWSVVVLGAGLANNDAFNLLFYNIVVLTCANFIFLFAHYESERTERNIWIKETLLRSKHRAITAENLELKKKLGGHVDLDSPAEKMIQALRKVTDAEGLDSEHLHAIDFVITQLRSGVDVFKPAVNKQVEDDTDMDRTTKSYLLQIGNARSRAATVTFNQHRRSPSRLTAGAGITDLDSGRTKSFRNTLEDWSFDIFGCDEATDGRALTFVAYHSIDRLDLFKNMTIDETKLLNFLSAIERGYHPRNPYHNATHAADVVQASYYFLASAGFASHFTDLDMLAIIIAGAIHDFDHPGTTNSFHIATSSSLALLYNDKSVLENHHVSAAWRLFCKEEMDFVDLSSEDRAKFRKLVIELVLATDLSQHFELVAKFRTVMSGQTYQKKGEDADRLMVTKLVLKCSDVSNPTKPHDLMMMWTDLYIEETFRQGDKERRLGIPISPFMDRTKPMIAKCEVGFINFLIRPLFSALAEFTGRYVNEVVEKEVMKHFNDNEKYWKDRLEALGPDELDPLEENSRAKQIIARSQSRSPPPLDDRRGGRTRGSRSNGRSGNRSWTEDSRSVSLDDLSFDDDRYYNGYSEDYSDDDRRW